MRYLVRIGIVLNFHIHTLRQSGGLINTEASSCTACFYLSLSLSRLRTGVQKWPAARSTHRNRGVRIWLEAFRLYIFLLGNAALGFSRCSVLSSGFSDLGSRYSVLARGEMCENWKLRNTKATGKPKLTHIHTLVKGSPGTRLRFRGLRNEKGQLAQRQAQMNRNEARCSHRNSSWSRSSYRKNILGRTRKLGGILRGLYNTTLYII